MLKLEVGTCEKLSRKPIREWRRPIILTNRATQQPLAPLRRLASLARQSMAFRPRLPVDLVWDSSSSSLPKRTRRPPPPNNCSKVYSCAFALQHSFGPLTGHRLLGTWVGLIHIVPELVTGIPFRWRIIIAKGGASGNEADAPEDQATDKKLESCFHAACELSCYLGLRLGLSWRPVQNCYGADPWGWKGRQRKGWAGGASRTGEHWGMTARVRAALATSGGVGV